MRLDERARQASDGIHHAVSTVQAPTEHRTAHPKWVAVVASVAGTLVVVLAAVAINTDNRQATGPVMTGGSVLFGEWHPRDQQASWFTIRPDGTGARNLHVLATCATWWPDGSKILITDDTLARTGHPLRPATINPDGSGLHPLTATPDPTLNLGCGDVSPDGRTVVAEGFNDTHPTVDGIYTISASDGGGLVRLTDSPAGGSDGTPRFSPDGRQVVFMRAKPGIGTEGAGALFVTATGGGTPRRITPWGSVFPGYDWSPDGQWLVFQHPYGQLYLIHPDGTGLHQLPLHLPDGAGAQNPSWSPDSNSIVFSLRTHGYANLCTVNIDGSGLRQITRTTSAQYQTPDWTTD